MTQSTPYVLSGARNFRSFNGYRNADGEQIKPGKLFRSGALQHSSPNALQHIRDEIRLSTVVDLRRPNERELTPNPDVGAEQHQICVVKNDSMYLWQAFVECRLDRGECEDFMLNYYRLLVREPAAEGYRQIFRLLLEDRGPLLFHCSAGKDRTGYLAAVIKMALGFDADLIMRDFLLSNEVIRNSGHWSEMREREDIPDEVDWESIAPLLMVNEEYLKSSLDEMHKLSGGVDAYLSERLGLDGAARTELRRILCTA
ncbi:MAG: tyrosine-protein phosphatase [Gammaproteobacteria bacterium AqS3]|nr:tyrosine-protein phosphatase [Gammaproteobacteria bacterium AqS3]